MTVSHTLSARQLIAFALVSLTAPAVAVCASLPWWWVLAASVLIGAWTLLLYALWRKTDAESLASAALQLEKPGKAALVFTALFVVLAMHRLCELSASSFPDSEPSPFIPLTMLAVCAWACAESRAAVLRAVGVAAFFVFAAYAVITAAALPSVQLSRAFTAADGDLYLLSTLLVPMLGSYLVRRSDPIRIRVSALLMFAFVPAAAAFLTATVPGADGSFYMMAKSAKTQFAAGRIEPIVSAAYTIGWFAALCLNALTVGEIFLALGGSRRVGVLLACAVSATAAVAELPLPSWFYALGATVFCAVIPLGILLLAPRKKDEKKSKKDEKST